GIVPVVKGNGYGFGLEVLLAEAVRLHGSAGVSQVAVGTYAEARLALELYPGDVLVLEPYRAVLHADLDHLGAGALIHNVVTEDDAIDLARRAGSHGRPRVVIEGLSSMNRYGVPVADLGRLLDRVRADEGPAIDLVALSLHLPLGDGHLAEVTRWVDEFPSPRWYLSHTSPGELASLMTRYPAIDVRPRIGTALWLGDVGALSVRGHVLEARPVAAGDHAGYRQRKLRDGTLIVVSGGTAHGVALEAPSAASTPRQRAIAVVEGVLEATGRVRSPFRIAGRAPWFVEPPHMQVSLLMLPPRATVPAIGDQVEIRVRHTTLHADEVVLS
ncbi:MAG: alanine racemase, partial [Lapillicoccus sp.]